MRITFARGLVGLAFLFGTSGCGQLQLPGRTPKGLAKNRQQCVECGLRDGGGPQDDPQAATKFRGWCEAGDPASCSALGVMYETGRGIPQDLAEAERLYQRACREGNGGSCVNLGRLLTRQDSPRRDTDAATLMFELACVQGETEGCFALGQQQYADGKTALAAKTMTTNCAAKHAASCETLGVFYARGLGVEQDVNRASHLFRNACGGGRPDACEWLSQLTHPHRGALRSGTRTTAGAGYAGGSPAASKSLNAPQ